MTSRHSCGGRKHRLENSNTMTSCHSCGDLQIKPIILFSVEVIGVFRCANKIILTLLIVKKDESTTK